MVPCGLGTPPMMGHAIDGGGDEAVFRRIILVSLGVEPRIVARERPLGCQRIREVHVDATGAGVLHVLVPTGNDGIAAVAAIGRGDRRRNLTLGHVHQDNHVVQTVPVAGDRSGELLPAIFQSGTPIVAPLGFQVGVAHIEEGRGAHRVQIAVVQLLGGGCLEALAPSGPQAEVAQGDHRAQLGGGTEPEVLVLVQAQAGSHIEPLQRGVFVLDIEGCGPVAGRARSGAHRGIQIVVAELGTGIQQVSGGQAHDALQRAHQPLLVALQAALSGKVGVVVGEPPCGVIAVGERRGGVFIIVGMLVPVHVEAHGIAATAFPSSAH